MTGPEARPVHSTAPGFPRIHARTRGFSLGVPRGITVGGDRVLFLRSTAEEPTQSLWYADDDGVRLVADPDVLMPPDLAADLPPEERARRERARERATGIVAYSADAARRQAAFTLAGKLMVSDLDTGQTVQLAVDGPVVTPALDPTGQRIAYVQGEALWVVRADGTNAPRMLANDRNPDVSWGLAEFVAGEEMGRTTGFWWAPDGARLLAARVDTAPVRRWWIAGPVDPDAAPTPIRYPAAGTDNAEVTLALVGLNGDALPVVWDRQALPYLVDVVWAAGRPPVLVVQSRDQQTLVHLAVDTDSGATSVLVADRSAPWIEIVPGSPAWTPDGRLARVVQTDVGTRGVALTAVDGEAGGGAGGGRGGEAGGGPDSEAVGGRGEGRGGGPGHGHDGAEQVLVDPALMVASLVAVDDDGVVVTAHVRARPWCTVVARLGLDGTTTLLSDDDGVADATAGGTPPRLAISQRHLRSAAVTVGVVDARTGEPTGTADITSRAMAPPALPVSLHGPSGGGDTPVRLLLHPDGWTPADGPLPVLVDSYGGPHARRVLAAGTSWLTSAWFAANGFAVLVVDGPGAPGQSLAWEARLDGDLAGPPLEGQVEALHAAAAAHPGLLDLQRVAIRGWSFGGYLAALAVMRRPEVFHAAVSGAPVTDWSLYDTHYTERYLGGDTTADAYRRSSIISDAPALARPLLLIHGLADDNVVAAHMLRLSRALLEAGRPHEVLPLSGVTHFTPSEEVNTNLLLLQLDFLRRALDLPTRAS